MTTTRSNRLFTRAQQILPGGVDSPVRAFKSVGASPVFIQRASGATIVDVHYPRWLLESSREYYNAVRWPELIKSSNAANNGS